MQSRYYNPDWGRFLNADAIVGQTGQLLSHNMFIYCANNPITMKDPNGFMFRLATDAGIDVDKMFTSVNTGNTVSKIVSKISNVTGSSGGTAALTASDSYTASKIVKAWNKWIFKPESFGQAIDRNLGTLYAASKVTKAFGAFALAGFAIGVWDNFANYKYGLGRTIIDTTAFAGSAIIGLGLATIGAPVFVGAVIATVATAALTLGADAVKKNWLNDPKD